MTPSGQPTAGAMSIVGTSTDLVGGGKVGFGPTLAPSGSLEVSPQAVSAAAAIAAALRRLMQDLMVSFRNGFVRPGKRRARSPTDPVE